ncbi:hypothetical protein [Achromobacter marplatensis]|uniref:hypothetical protein n=1 Tax=Achromobacter marplatensis TaxID=470868 RepID=UPI003D08F71A
MEESYLRKLIKNIDKQNEDLNNKSNKLYHKINSISESSGDKLEGKSLKIIKRLESKFLSINDKYISNLETIEILEDKLQEILLEKNEQKFDFEIGNEATRDIEPTKEEKEKNKFGVAVTYFSLCLIPIAILLIIANLIKDFLS